MILIAAAWLLILAIAFFQSIYGLFSAVVTAVLTTICAVVALGTYEWMGDAFLYKSQAAYADALSLTIHFVIPLLALRIVFDKLIPDNAPLGRRADQIAGGIVGLYVGVVMVGVLTIVVQMLPFGASIYGYTPFDRSLQRSDRLYCDEFALGLFKASAGLASDRSFAKAHDNLLLELFCARNTAGLKGRVDTAPGSLNITEAFQPNKNWSRVIGHPALPHNPGREKQDSDILILRTEVSKTARGSDDWYRLPATHFRLVTGNGVGLYPLGYIKPIGPRWELVPAAQDADKSVDLTGLCFLKAHKKKTTLEVFWVYRLPKPEAGSDDFGDVDKNSKEGKRLQAERDALYQADYMVFRRTARMPAPVPTPDSLPVHKKPKPE